MARMPRLLIGPLLRHVGRTEATVWVETDEPCTVEVLGCREHTWTVAGHHYALIVVEGLEPGSTTPYEVRLDGERAWPPLRQTHPPSTIRTLGDDRPLRLAFGSCRYGRAAAKLGDRHFTPDSLACFAREMASTEPTQWPDAFLMLGDQVYADETSAATQRRIRQKRDITSGAKDQVADFEEYTWLYLESWTDPDVRWLMSTVSTSMIFDDHDVRDDWNTSHAWRLDMQRTSWWEERIIGGLSSYWIYQHLGNLAPADLAEDTLYQKVRASEGDAEQLVREFARAADREADGGKGARWSYRRDFGKTRLLVIDSRCGRVLDGERSMVSEDEFAWIEEQVEGNHDHLLVGTSLPWLMPRGLHDIESWNEALASGSRGRLLANWAEKVRRAADLEHWAAFCKSFDRLGRLLESVGRGEHAEGGVPPATVCVLSGDVHHAYIAEVNCPDGVQSRIFQLTCSPLHNHVPLAMQFAFRVAWSRLAERLVRAFLRVFARVPAASVSWRKLSGPFFGNEVATLEIDGRSAETVLRRSADHDAPEELIEVARLKLAG